MLAMIEQLEPRRLLSEGQAGFLDGDWTRDGKIDGDDYNRADAHVGQHVTPFADGDWTGDGFVDGDDYFPLDSNLHQTWRSLTGLTNANGLIHRTKTSGGDLFTSSNGQIIRDTWFDGVDIQFQNNDVRVINCKFSGHPTPFWVIGGIVSGCSVEHCDISWSGGTAVVGRGVSFTSCWMHDAVNQDWARNVGNCSYIGNLFDNTIKTNPGDGAHLDLFQWYQANFSAANLILRNNVFNCPINDPGHNAVVFNNFALTGIEITANVIIGSSYALRFSPAAGTAIELNVFRGQQYNGLLWLGTRQSMSNTAIFWGNQSIDGGGVFHPYGPDQVSYTN